jgi:parallel beta-helix repeat protein
MHTTILVELKKIVLLTFALVLLSTAVAVRFVRPVGASGPIYIRADGSVEGTTHITSVDNMTYTLTGNITSDTDGIVLRKDNIVINGAGHALQGPFGFGKSDPKTIGIHLSEKSNVTIKNIKIHGFTYGVFLSSSSNNIISKSNITDNYHGIHFTKSSNNTISENRITNANSGIRLVSSNYNRIYGNKVTNNVEGIKIEDACSNNYVVENNVANNWNGVQLIQSSTNTISENNITTNKGRGLWLWSSFGNQIYHNNIINNTIQADIQVSNYTNSWDNGGEGNYWSDYVGIDDNSDGIGDTPYVIDENNIDNYPLMGPLNLDSEAIPLWMQWSFWTIVAVIIIAGGVIITYEYHR